MKGLIRSIEVTTKLYRQPKRIGELLEHNKKFYVVIGIQAVSIIYANLRIRYICQDAEKDFVYQPPTSEPDSFREFYIKITTGKEHVLEDVTLGKLFWYQDKPYQTVEYTDIEIKFTDVVVSFLARPIRPIARKEAKAKLLSERRKKLQLEVL